MSGVDLGGKTLTAGVYNFSSSAFLTGIVPLTLNGQGNPNSVFIFNIGSNLTTGPASSVVLTNGAQGSNVFWRVGITAALDTTTSFVGDILALTSITLNNGASINCGAAWAQNAEVTLINNVITICTPAAAASASSVLPSSANASNARSQIPLIPLPKRRHAAAAFQNLSLSCRPPAGGCVLASGEAGTAPHSGDSGDELVPVAGDQSVRQQPRLWT
jgi:hypothetical protein